MDWNKIVSEILYTLITVIVPMLAYYIISYYKARRDDISESTSQLIVHDTLMNALDIIAKAVNCTTQTYVESMKASGQFTAEAQQIAFNKSKDAILTLLDDSSKDLLTSLYGDLDKWIEIQIEDFIKKSKVSKEGE